MTEKANQAKAWDAKLQGLPSAGLMIRLKGKGSQLSIIANRSKGWDAKLQGLNLGSMDQEMAASCRKRRMVKDEKD